MTSIGALKAMNIEYGMLVVSLETFKANTRGAVLPPSSFDELGVWALNRALHRLW